MPDERQEWGSVPTDDEYRDALEGAEERLATFDDRLRVYEEGRTAAAIVELDEARRAKRERRRRFERIRAWVILAGGTLSIFLLWRAPGVGLAVFVATLVAAYQLRRAGR